MVAFGVEQTWVGSAAVVSVRGDIDALTAPQLTEAILNVIPEQPSVVIVDLSAVDFLASTGITVLISAHEYIAPKAKFGVVADGPGTSRPLKMMSVDLIFPLYSTLAEALSASEAS